MLLNNSILQFCPEILNWIEVRAISRPFQQFDIVAEQLHCSLHVKELKVTTTELEGQAGD